MFRHYLLIFLLAHIIGDFYLQTESLSLKKDESIKWVIIHGLYYLLIMLLAVVPVISCHILSGALIASASHLFIDLLKYRYMASKKAHMSQPWERNVFFADQGLHIISIIGVSYWLAKNNVPIRSGKTIAEFFDLLGLSGPRTLSWFLALLVVGKPANIGIQKLLAMYKPLDTNKGQETLKAGRFIGTVERIIMLIFLSIGQYSVLGLVLTAKSIARYDKISKEKDFAEYYLLGTLISTLIVILASFILIK